MFPSLAAKVGGKAGKGLVARITTGVAIAVAVVTVFAVVLVGGMIAAMAGGGGSEGGDEGELDCSRPVDSNAVTVIPGFLMPIYEHASQEVDRAPDGTVTHKALGARGIWILAAINKHRVRLRQEHGAVERGRDRLDAVHARDLGHLPAVTATATGRWTPYDPDDAIHGSAKMLRASGAPANWLRAVHSYNPGAAEVEGDPTTNWYAEDVMSLSEESPGELRVRGGRHRASASSTSRTPRGPGAGSMKFAKALASLGTPFGCIPTSEKRGTQNTASAAASPITGSGARNAYAIDIAGPECTLDYPGGDADRTARAIAKALDFPVHGGELFYAGDCIDQQRGPYRFQLIWATQCGGDHTDHVHIGVRLLERP